LGKQGDDVDAHPDHPFPTAWRAARRRLCSPLVTAFANAMAAYERGAFVQAIELFDSAIAADEQPAQSLCKRGVCRLRLGDRVGAERDFRAALAADDRCVSAMVDLGNLALESHEFEEAHIYYRRALSIDETYAFAHYNLGILHRKLGNVGASVAELRLAAKYEAAPTTARKRLSFWKRRSK